MGPPPGNLSAFPVNYGTGELYYSQQDIHGANGFGKPWGHSRNFQNRLTGNQLIGHGYNWQVTEWPILVIGFQAREVTAMGKADSAYFFDKVGGSYVARFGVTAHLELDTVDGVYRLTETDGSVTEYDDFTGMFRKQISPGGEVIEVTAMAPNGYNFTQVQRQYTSGSDTYTEQLLYTYIAPYADQLLQSVTLRRKVNSGAWQNISRCVYTYYGPDEDFGGLEDLQTATTQSWSGSTWTDTGTSYYRYYPEYDSTPSSSGSSGAPTSWAPTAHLLMYVLNAAAYERLSNDPGVTDPLTASNSIVSLYADHYFEYDSDRRVTKELVQGGSQTYLYAYEESDNDDDFNSWKIKTTETRPDGNQFIVYSNYAAGRMLSVLKSGTDEWIEFTVYDADGRIALFAAPSAVTGYDDNYTDLLNYNSGTSKYQFLRDSDGLIYTYSYHAPSGFMASESLQQGQLGDSIKLHEYEYVACGGAPSGSSSSSGGGAQTWFMSRQIDYPSDTDQTKQIITAYSYTWYSGTCQVQQRTTTLPAVATNQNGSGASATRKEYKDLYDNTAWLMDERGYITRLKYDIVTGALTQKIDDVDTSVETDAPSGWTTPSDGGLNLVTDFESDNRGRITQILGPSHSIDLSGTATTIRRAAWMVYAETAAANETRSARGYATGTSPSYTYTLVNPVSIRRTDKNGNLQEQIEATRASTSGKLQPTDSFSQSSYTRWTTYQYTDCCHVASQRAYFDIPSSGTGTEGTNYNETDYGYDMLKRRNRTVTPGGTITRLVFNSRSLVTATWVGTDDTGATSSDPSGGGASGNNMVIITGNEYDDGTDGGDGLLTEQTQYVSGTDNRVTSFTYDFRDRRTTVDGEIDYFQKDYYDNLSRVVKSERYDTSSSGNLIARNETKYDDRGRVYQRVRYGVDPSTGTVGNSLTDNLWYDPSGNTLKDQPSGSDLFTKSTYDSLGRRTRLYRGYDLDESTYAEAGTVTGDTILEQSETTYDDAGNVIQATTRQRYHNAPASQTGELKNPSETPKARVTYVAQYPDAIGRSRATANYGTNGGSALSRPATIPTRSDTVLVTSSGYDSAGSQTILTDPNGMVVGMQYDDLGRETSKVLGVVAGSSSSSSGGLCQASDDENVTVTTAYNADGNVASITAVNPVTGNQTTQYVYGTTLSDSDVATSTLKRKEIYPDSVDGSDVILFAYNRQSQVTQVTDQNGTVHAYDFDKLGRQTQDRVTTLGTGVDAAVRRIAATYEVRGMRETLTSYDNATVGSGGIVNDVQFAYNDFAQLTHDYQAHGGAVNTSTSPNVQYGYANSAANTIRPTSLTYPDGRVLTYGYGTADGINDASSRVEALIDDDGSSTHLADYDYLGSRTFVECDYTQPQVRWTLADLSGSNDPDTGDIYSGFDRFGRIKDNRWYDDGSSADVDRIQYGYDRSGNRLWRENVVARSLSKEFDELYTNDLINRLKDLQRGTLASGNTSLSSKTFAECWTLDPTGNWKGFRQDDNGNGTWDLNQSRTANEVNEITDISETAGPSWVTPAYNRAGNMTTLPQPADPTASYTATYDAWNRLVKLADGSDTVSEYQYDGAKRRIVQKSFAGGVLNETRHLYYTEPSKWQVIEERVGTSTDPNCQWAWGLRYIDDCVLRDRDTTSSGTLDERLYALQDANWNVDCLIDTTGDPQERYAYTAYGSLTFLTATFGSRTTSSYDWNTLYAGYRWETGTKLFHVRHRVYHSVLGTWVQRDPLGGDVEANILGNSSYNPLDGSDPLGLMWVPAGATPAFCYVTGRYASTTGRPHRGGSLCNFTCHCPPSTVPGTVVIEGTGFVGTYHRRPCSMPPTPYCTILVWQPDPVKSFCDIDLPDVDPGLIAALLAAGLSAALVYACLAFPPCGAAAAAGAGVYLLLLILENNGLA